MRIVFSRDRPAQLDLLLRSLEQNDPWQHPQETVVIWKATNDAFADGYSMIPTEAVMREQTAFDTDLRWALGQGAETVCFWCDDDVLYRQIPHDPAAVLLANEQMIAFRLTLGQENHPLPPDFPLWRWRELKPTDFGYPCGLDGLNMRVADVLNMCRERIDNPQFVETVLVISSWMLAGQMPLAGCFARQCAVGVPVNRVSDSSTIPVGQVHPGQTTRKLNDMWRKGFRIVLDANDFRNVAGVHHEIMFRWEPR